MKEVKDSNKINVEKELMERGYEKEIIDEWISYI